MLPPALAHRRSQRHRLFPPEAGRGARKRPRSSPSRARPALADGARPRSAYPCQRCAARNRLSSCALLSFRDNHGLEPDRHEFVQLGAQISEPNRVQRSGKRSDLRTLLAARKDLRRRADRELNVIGPAEAARVEHRRKTPTDRWACSSILLARHALIATRQNRAGFVTAESDAPGLQILC